MSPVAPIVPAAQLTFASKWVPQLWGELRRRQKGRKEEIERIGNIFGDPLAIARHYVQSDCQQNNPSTEDRDFESVVRQPVFETLSAHIAKCHRDPVPDGRRHLFVLADAGMGKSSLLVMLKLTHLVAFWPKQFRCELLKLSPEALTAVAALKESAHTVLLLDSLDEDSSSWGDPSTRITEILKATANFLAVIVTCRTQFFPSNALSPEGKGSIRVSGFRCH